MDEIRDMPRLSSLIGISFEVVCARHLDATASKALDNDDDRVYRLEQERRHGWTAWNQELQQRRCEPFSSDRFYQPFCFTIGEL